MIEPILSLSQQTHNALEFVYFLIKHTRPARVCGYYEMRQEELKYYPEFVEKHNLRYEPENIMPECSSCDGLDTLCRMRNDDLFVKESKE